MDEIVKKIGGLGLPGILLVILTAATGGVGSSTAVATVIMSLGGPFGVLGGLGVLGLVAIVGDAVTGYGVEAVLNAIYIERSKTESVRYLRKEIKDLPITDELKVKLEKQLSPETITDTQQEVEHPRPIEIVE